MHKKIRAALRGPIGAALEPFVLSAKYSERSGFWDSYTLSLSDQLKVILSVVASPSTDTFTITVTWETGRVPQSTWPYIPKRRICDGDSVEFDLSDAPSSYCLDLGMLIYGRPITYHFLGRFPADAIVPIETLYSSGDGPEYRSARVPQVIQLIARQKDEYLMPFLRALSARNTPDEQ